MAAAKLPKATKEKKPRVKKQFVAIGDEPVVLNPDNLQMIKALNWFNIQWSPDNAKKWIVAYMNHNKYSKDDVNTVAGKARKITPTIASLSRLYMNGSVIEPTYHEKIKSVLETLIDSKKPDLDEDGNPIIVVKASKPKAVPSEMLEYIDNLIARSMAGEKLKEDIYAHMLALKANAWHLSELTSEYASTLSELKELMKKEDEQLLEAYDTVSWKAVTNTIELLENMNTQFKQLKVVTKNATVRKPRVKKAPKLEKVVARLKYQKENADFRVVSIDPTKIIGAKYLVTFNTKNRVLSYYQAKEGGFAVKGTSIFNFDEEKSKMKALRKPLDILPLITTRINLERTFKQLKTTERSANGRMNDTTILYKVW